MKQRLLRNRPGSALRPLATPCAKDYKAHSLYQTSFAESPNRTSTYHVGTGVGRFRAFTRGPAASIVLAALQEIGTVPVVVAVLSAHPPQAGPGEFRFGAHAFLCQAQN